MDDSCRRKLIAELETALSPLQQEFGAPIPADYVKEAVNALDRLSNFPGAKLPVSGALAAPNSAFFNKLCSHIRLVYTNLTGSGFTVTKQDIEAALSNLRQGLVT